MTNEPKLAFAFEIKIKVEPGKGIETGDTPKGFRRLIPIVGGSFEGPDIRGTVLPGGYDFQLLRNDNVTEIDARYVLQTDDGALITIVNRGLRRADKKVMQQMASGKYRHRCIISDPFLDLKPGMKNTSGLTGQCLLQAEFVMQRK